MYSPLDWSNIPYILSLMYLCRLWTHNPSLGCGTGLEQRETWLEEEKSCRPAKWVHRPDRWARRYPHYCVQQKSLMRSYRKNTVYKVLVDQESLTSFPRFYNCNFSLSSKTKMFFIVFCYNNFTPINSKYEIDFRKVTKVKGILLGGI